MATTRKRTSGFSSPEETEETPTFDALTESVSEVTEVEEQVEVLATPPKPFVEETIAPTEDLGPRFLEEAPAPEPKKVQPPELKPAPKRQPRNVPKFSRLR